MVFLFRALVPFTVLLLAGSSSVVGQGIRSPLASPSFPLRVTVNTTRDVASKYSSNWDVQKKDSRSLEGESIQLSILVYSKEDVALLERLEAKGLLEYQADNRQEQRDLKEKESASSRLLSCYRSVEETFGTMEYLAEQYPGFVSLDAIGESYLKQQGQRGYDIRSMVINNNASTVVEKHDMMVVGGHHPREMPPPETIMRWVEHLLENYGKDADVTWVLDRTRIHVVPLANPDGREIVEAGDANYRKNARPNSCKNPDWHGVDLNRNYPMWYGLNSGSSDNPCNTDYRGTGPLSEPETSAVFQYADSVFSDSIKKGTVEEAEARSEEACPMDASGIYIDIHSAGGYVYFPWGHDERFAPNHHSLLTMGAKLALPGDYQLWAPAQNGFLYYASGDATDAIYGVHCVASFGFETGSRWAAPCNELDNSIVPIMFEALLYAAKSVRAPYQIPLGPDITSIFVDPTPQSTHLEVGVSDEDLIVPHANFEEEKSQNIASVRVWVDEHPYDAKDGGILMNGEYDDVRGVAVFNLDTLGWRGTHTFYFRATDTDGNEGPVSAVYAEYPEIAWPLAPREENEDIAWP